LRSELSIGGSTLLNPKKLGLRRVLAATPVETL
jgi:hypothetical protein